jgi:hypothetical protein
MQRFPSFGIFDVEHAAQLAAVEDETALHCSNVFRSRLQGRTRFLVCQPHQTGSESRHFQ